MAVEVTVKKIDNGFLVDSADWDEDSHPRTSTYCARISAVVAKVTELLEEAK